MPSLPSRLIVRLPNHLGDACMCLPALDLLTTHGHDLTLVGRGWARKLFAAYDWPVASVGDFWPTVRTLRSLGRTGSAPSEPNEPNKTNEPNKPTAPTLPTPGLLFTNSFNTALQFRLAGIPATGYARDGRSALLRVAVPVPAAWRSGMHMVEYYLALATTLTGTVAPAPPQLALRLTDQTRTAAHATLTAARVQGDYVVLCPAAVGLHRGQVKAWSGYGRLAADLRAHANGLAVVACPGPGETAAVQAAVQTEAPHTIVLPEVDVDVFAALLERARLVVANDSGAGHVAAAVNAPLLTVIGVTEPQKTRPWGPRARLVGSAHGWPVYEEVLAAALSISTG